MSELEIPRQNPTLPLMKAIRIAWKSIRVRWWRSILVTSGIILAVSFLMYTLTSESMAGNVSIRGSEDLIEALKKEGKLATDQAKDKTQMWWIVGLALLISFVGVLNAMVMSVTERFREIGTMKCLGAVDNLIVRLFFLESLFQGLVGTTAGILIGLILTFLEALALYGGNAWTLLTPAELFRLIGMCFLAGSFLTVAGALYPAWRAARMEPVDAMRSEV